MISRFTVSCFKYQTWCRKNATKLYVLKQKTPIISYRNQSSYRNRGTKESTHEKSFHNPAYNDYEIPVKTQADEGDGYEELPVDLCADSNKKAVHPDTYDIYLAITE